jgi:hypothetical protein
MGSVLGVYGWVVLYGIGMRKVWYWLQTFEGFKHHFLREVGKFMLYCCQVWAFSDYK